MLPKSAPKRCPFVSTNVLRNNKKLKYENKYSNLYSTTIIQPCNLL
jgi:hypothetical protein